MHTQKHLLHNNKSLHTRINDKLLVLKKLSPEVYAFSVLNQFWKKSYYRNVNLTHVIPWKFAIEGPVLISKINRRSCCCCCRGRSCRSSSGMCDCLKSKVLCKRVQWRPGVNFINLFLLAFFVNFFGAKLRFSLAPKIRTKKARKKRWWN